MDMTRTPHIRVIAGLLVAALSVAWLTSCYEADPLFGDVSITSAAGHEIWLVGSEHTVTCTTVTDYDTCTEDQSLHQDTVTHWWTGTSEQFEDNDYIGTEVVYICRDITGSETVTVHADDHFSAEGYENTALADDYASPKSDSQDVSVVRLEIAESLGSYYADSASWMPFRFKLAGAPGEVTVDSGTVEFYIGDEQQFEASIVLKPFKPSNGTAHEYLAVVDESGFDDVSTGNEIIENGRLKLTNVSGTVSVDTEDIDFGPFDSELSADIRFGDDTVEVIEFGVGQPQGANLLRDSFSFRKAQTRQDVCDLAETNKIRHVAGIEGGVGDLPQPGVTMELLGFTDWYAGAGPPLSGLTYTQRSMLESDQGIMSGGLQDQTVEARSLNRQLGIAFVAYRNQVPADHSDNPFGVPVVGTVVQYPGDIKVFNGGTLAATIQSTHGNDLQRFWDYSSTALGIASFVAPGFGQALGPALALTQALVTASNLLDVTEDAEKVATVAAHKVVAHAGDANPAVDLAFGGLVYQPPGDSDNAVIHREGFGMVVNEQRRAYLATTTNVRATSVNWPYDVTVDAKLEVNLAQGLFEVFWTPIPAGNAGKIACDQE